MIPPQRDYFTRQIRSADQRITTLKDSLVRRTRRVKQLEGAIIKLMKACACDDPDEGRYCWSVKSEKAAEELFELVQQAQEHRANQCNQES